MTKHFEEKHSKAIQSLQSLPIRQEETFGQVLAQGQTPSARNLHM